MANKTDLIASILELDANAATDELTNAQLTKLLSEIKAGDDAAHDNDDDALLPASVEEVKPHPYSIAKGKSVVCKKGILAHGDEINADYLGGGQEALDVLVEAKVVIKA